MMTESEIKTKILSKQDQTYFLKVLQCYFFFKQKTTTTLAPELENKLIEGSNVVYSLILSYLSSEKFEIGFLQDVNELLKSIFELTAENANSGLSIDPLHIGEITFQESVPIEFNDAETHQKLQVLYHAKDGICLWSLVNA